MCIDYEKRQSSHPHIYYMSKTMFIHYCGTEMVVSGSTFDHLDSSPGSRYVCCMLCGMVHNKLVYNNHPREAEYLRVRPYSLGALPVRWLFHLTL